MNLAIKKVKKNNNDLLCSSQKELKNITHSNTIDFSQESIVSLLPSYCTPEELLIGDGLPCHGARICNRPTKSILKKINRQVWVEGLYVKNEDLNKIIRYKNFDGSYKNDFDRQKFSEWMKNIENNTALCEMESKSLGSGIFVPPGKKLPQGTFIPSSGIIKLNPTIEELETKSNCSALQNLNSLNKEIVGIIDPEKIGGILNFINHAPDKDEIANFKFKKSFDQNNIATANLRCVIKYYNGYAVMGLESVEDIHGGAHGVQLLWSYARTCEYIRNDSSASTCKRILLFNNRDKSNGETIPENTYSLMIVTVFINTGDPILRKAVSFTRWEVMEKSPESCLLMAMEDPFSGTLSEPIQSYIPYKYLQTYLMKNVLADSQR